MASALSDRHKMLPAEWERDRETPWPLWALILLRDGAPEIKKSSVWQPESLVLRASSSLEGEMLGLAWTITVRSLEPGESSESGRRQEHKDRKHQIQL